MSNGKKEGEGIGDFVFGIIVLGAAIYGLSYLVKKGKEAKAEKEQATQNLQGYNQRVIDDYRGIG